ncbi:MAG: DUF6783 domain-containing protein [Lachnospiraceae bacterium]
MRVKYTAKWGVQIAKMIFQTRSSITKTIPLPVHRTRRTHIEKQTPFCWCP